jgi:hypothetical protein
MRNSLDIIFFFTGILSLISKSLEWSALSASPLCASDFSLPDGNVYKSEAQEDHFLSAL